MEKYVTVLEHSAISLALAFCDLVIGHRKRFSNRFLKTISHGKLLLKHTQCDSVRRKLKPVNKIAFRGTDVEIVLKVTPKLHSFEFVNFRMQMY